MKKTLTLLLAISLAVSCGCLKRASSHSSDIASSERYDHSSAKEETSAASFEEARTSKLSAGSAVSCVETEVTEVYELGSASPDAAAGLEARLKSYTRTERRREIEAKTESSEEGSAVTSARVEGASASESKESSAAEGSISERTEEKVSRERFPAGAMLFAIIAIAAAALLMIMRPGRFLTILKRH